MKVIVTVDASHTDVCDLIGLAGHHVEGILTADSFEHQQLYSICKSTDGTQRTGMMTAMLSPGVMRRRMMMPAFCDTKTAGMSTSGCPVGFDMMISDCGTAGKMSNTRRGCVRSGLHGL